MNTTPTPDHTQLARETAEIVRTHYIGAYGECYTTEDHADLEQHILSAIAAATEQMQADLNIAKHKADYLEKRLFNVDAALVAALPDYDRENTPASQGVGRLHTERDALRAEVKNLEATLVSDRKIQDCLRRGASENGEREAQLRAEIERLKEWPQTLSGWGGTPSIVDEFIKGQQSRIHSAQLCEEENDKLRSRVVELEQNGAIAPGDFGVNDWAELKTRIASLEQDKARLDWLEKRGACFRGADKLAEETGDEKWDNWIIGNETEWAYGDLRAAIDAAKEGGK